MDSATGKMGSKDSDICTRPGHLEKSRCVIGSWGGEEWPEMRVGKWTGGGQISPGLETLPTSSLAVAGPQAGDAPVRSRFWTNSEISAENGSERGGVQTDPVSERAVLHGLERVGAEAQT